MCSKLLVDREKQSRYVSVHAAVIPRTQRFIVSFAEIPADPQKANEFEYENLQMSGVIYNIPEPTFAIDRNGRIIAWNRAIEELTGVFSADILKKDGHEYAIPFFGERRSDDY